MLRKIEKENITGGHRRNLTGNSNKETLYKNFVRFLVREGAFNRKSSLLTDKITLHVRNPAQDGVQSFFEDVMVQLLKKM